MGWGGSEAGNLSSPKVLREAGDGPGSNMTEVWGLGEARM